MKLLIALCVLGAAALLAAEGNSDPDRILVPWGNWIFCDGGTSPIANALPGFSCANVKPGDEQYLLSLRAKESNTVKFYYTVIGTCQGDGSMVIVSKQAVRNDSQQGFTNILLSTGCRFSGFSVAATER